MLFKFYCHYAFSSLLILFCSLCTHKNGILVMFFELGMELGLGKAKEKDNKNFKGLKLDYLCIYLFLVGLHLTRKSTGTCSKRKKKSLLCLVIRTKVFMHISFHFAFRILDQNLGLAYSIIFGGEYYI